MIKKIRPNKISTAIERFPHCDPKVLHAPGECGYCDKHPDWQQLRQVWGITFTGYEPENEKETLCPAMKARPETYAAWHGNTAKTASKYNSYPRTATTPTGINDRQFFTEMPELW